MTVTIPTTHRLYFRQALQCLKVIPPLNKLTSKELDILAEFLYWNYHYKALDQKVRNKIIFNYETRVEMRDYLNMREAIYNNYLTSLRKKGVITNRGISTDYGLDPDKGAMVIFKFVISE